jgi:hypothetical protein
MEIFYGVENNMLNVTNIFFKKCKIMENSYFINDNKNVLFGDNYHCVVKILKIILNEKTYLFSEYDYIIFHENIFYSYGISNVNFSDKFINIKISYSNDNFYVKSIMVNVENITMLKNIKENNIKNAINFINNEKKISYEITDNYFLLFYGQLRTFKQCIPIMLKFLKHNIIRYDIYLMIDKTNDPNFTNENLELLLSMFKKENVKKIWYIQDHNNSIVEEKKVVNYFKMCDEIKKEVQYDTTTDYFVSKLYHRRLLTLNIFKNYCFDNNLNYKYGVFTRFDINLKNQMENNLMFNHNYKLYIGYDVLFIGSLNQLLEIFNFSNNYFSIYSYYNKYGKIGLINFLIKHKMINNINSFDYFCRVWIAMPEANFKFYVITQNIEHIELYFGYIIQR